MPFSIACLTKRPAMLLNGGLDSSIASALLKCAQCQKHIFHKMIIAYLKNRTKCFNNRTFGSVIQLLFD